MTQDATLPASDIPVVRFRQIHHIPLIWKGCDGCDGCDAFDFDKVSEQLRNADWQIIENPLSALAEDKSSQDTDVFDEFVYFHDFAREFLYPKSKDAGAFHLFHRPDPGRIDAVFENDCGSHSFSIERLHLHLFHTGTVIITVETLHDGASALNLSQVQTIIDHFRRSHTSYWQEGEPQRVPRELVVRTANGVPERTKEQTRDEMVNFLYVNRDVPLLEHWKGWAKPLALKDWRHLSDERVPAMSFIALEKKTEATPRDTMDRVRKGDWFRLAEADEAGSAPFEYNPEFLERLERERAFFHDRFYPHEQTYDFNATRHVFGGAHYSMVTVDGAFTRKTLEPHFRRHYEKLALVARFEHASLLAFSSRITHLVARLDREGFRKGMLELHREFLEFTHWFRFTDITSQIQGAEMFRHWRRSLNLDKLFEDVKAEISSAADLSLAQEADERAARANMLALVGLFVAAFLTAPGLLEFDLMKNIIECMSAKMATWGWTGFAPCVQLGVPLVVAFFLVTVAVFLAWLLGRVMKRCQKP